MIYIKKISGFLWGFLLLILLEGCQGYTFEAQESINSTVIEKDNNPYTIHLPKTKTLGIVWYKYPNISNDGLPGAGKSPSLPVFPTKGQVNPDDPGVTDPCVIKLGPDDYRMWYTRIEETNTGGYPSYSYRIGYAVSSNGIDWSDVRTPHTVPEISSDPASPMYGLEDLRVSSVVKTEGKAHRYRLFFLGKEKDTSAKGWKLYYAYTNSLEKGQIDWKTDWFGELAQAMEPDYAKFDETSLSRGTILKEQTGYKMWYGGRRRGSRKIGYAQSEDGKSKWHKGYEIISAGFASNNIFDNRYIDYPCVMKDNRVYLMWYSGFNLPWAIGLAYSLDGKNFIYYDDRSETSLNNPVLKPESFWESRGVLNCTVIKDSKQGKTVYKMWYTAEGNDKKLRIGYAESYLQDK